MDENSKEKLWDLYAKNKNPELREKIIIEYAPIVKLVAGRLSMYLGYNVEYEDLVSYGIFGLIDAIDKYDFNKNVKFETYASLRIRGAILDQIRKMDWIPRTLRQKQKKLEQAMHEFEVEFGRAATSEELSKKMDISVEELKGLVNQTQIASLVSLDEYLEQGSDISPEGNNKSCFESPEQVIDRQELKRTLTEAIEALNDNEQKVIAFYYFEELTLKEISKVLGVSESRVSQLHTKALKKMREKIGKENMGIFSILNI